MSRAIEAGGASRRFPRDRRCTGSCRLFGEEDKILSSSARADREVMDGKQITYCSSNGSKWKITFFCWNCHETDIVFQVLYNNQSGNTIGYYYSCEEKLLSTDLETDRFVVGDVLGSRIAEVI